MIFYYTATGNCLYVAKNIEDNPFSIPQELKKQNLEYKDETIGIVAPVYAGELPKTVRKFIEKAKFETDYFYLLLTYGKNDSVASTWSQSFCQDNHIHVDYVQTIKMVDNYLPSFDMEEEMAMDKKVDEQIKVAIENINKKTAYIPEPTQAGKDLYAVASKRFQEHPELNNGESIMISDMCAGCTICTQVCPIGNIEIIDKKAVRKSKTCDFCLACAHHCPFHAIQLVVDKNPDKRYRNPHVSLKDIVKSNDQTKEKVL